VSEQPPLDGPDETDADDSTDEVVDELGTASPPLTEGDRIEPIDLNTEMQR